MGRGKEGVIQQMALCLSQLDLFFVWEGGESGRRVGGVKWSVKI